MFKSFTEGFKQGYAGKAIAKPIEIKRNAAVKNPVVPPAAPKRKFKKMLASAVLVGLGITIFHAGTPYITLYNAKSTVESNNKEDIKNMLEDHVEFDNIRKDANDILTEYSEVFIDSLNKELDKDLADNPFKDFAKAFTTGLAEKFIPNMINMVVKEINPNNIATAIVNNDGKADMSKCNVKLISFGKAEYNCKNLTFHAESNGFTWKVTGLTVSNKEEIKKELIEQFKSYKSL
jgi:hypothetical protein